MSLQRPQDRTTTVPGPGPRAGRLAWAAPALRYWGVVVVVVALCVTGAVVSTFAVDPTYTGRASLIVSSPNRSPAQDAVLVEGYADYFNDLAYQTRLAEEADLSAAVVLVAVAAPPSPILLVEATSTDAETAQDSASAVATAFRVDINGRDDGQRDEQAAVLQERIAAAAAAAEPDAVLALEEQLGDLRGDTTGQLQELQLRGGVTADSPDLLTNVALAGFGGLLLGVLAALGLAGPRRLAARRAADLRAGRTSDATGAPSTARTTASAAPDDREPV